MRRNSFNEPILQPEDDFAACWVEEFGDEPDGEIARFIEQGDDGLYGCTISDNNDNEIDVEDFESEEALLEWLAKNDVEVD